MAPASLLLLAEVMDKTLSLSEHWLWALVFGLAGYGLARWRVWTVAVVAPVVLLLAGALLADLRDPYWGPAIVAEAGRGYVVGSCAAYVVALLLLLAGVALGLRRRRATGGTVG